MAESLLLHTHFRPTLALRTHVEDSRHKTALYASLETQTQRTLNRKSESHTQLSQERPLPFLRRARLCDKRGRRRAFPRSRSFQPLPRVPARDRGSNGSSWKLAGWASISAVKSERFSDLSLNLIAREMLESADETELCRSFRTVPFRLHPRQID